MRISMIVAKSKNGVIGDKGGLPWKLKSDLAHFKQTTMGHHMLMGRKTFESLGGPLPGRMHLVLSSESRPAFESVLWFTQIFRAIKHAERQGEKELFIIGGAQIYKAALPLVDRIYLTEIQAEVTGDTQMPALSHKNWNLVSEQVFPKSEGNDHAFTIRVLDRKRF